MPSSSDRNHAPWRLWILVLFWILQYLFLILEIVIIVVAIIVIANSPNRFTSGTIAGASIQTILIALTLGLSIAEPILAARRRMTPKFYTISSIVKTTIWVAIVVAAAVLNDKRGQYASSPISIIITIVLVALFAIPMIYGGIVWIKERRRIAASALIV